MKSNMKLLLYCTKGKEILWWNKKFDKGYQFFMDGRYNRLLDECPDFLLNGKIVAECDFEVEEIVSHRNEYETKTFSEFGLCDKSCLTHQELFDYFKNRSDNEKYNHNGYAIHIKNLHIFDEPKELSEYTKNVEHCKCDECLENCKKYCKYYYAKNNITQTINTGCIKYALFYKAPQNMMYVFDGEEKKILISIRPEHLCKELNGEKEIELRKIVLKEML